MPQNNRPSDRSAERGNVFIFILLGIALFAALSYTISRGFQSQNTSVLSARDAELAATDIINYAQQMSRAVDRVRRKSCSENDISFDQSIETGYNHTPAVADKCKVFNTSGGNARWTAPPTGANDGSTWIYNGETCIADTGTGATGCDSDTTSNEELLMILPNMTQAVCEKINEELGLATTLTNTGAHDTTKFQGTFQDGSEIIVGSSNKTACIVKSGVYTFYSVLLVR